MDVQNQWEFLSDKGWLLYSDETGQLLNKSRIVDITLHQSGDIKTFAVDLLKGHQTNQESRISRKIRRVVWEYLNNDKCIVFEHTDAEKLENAYNKGIGNLWGPCSVRDRRAVVYLAGAESHFQMNASQTVKRRVKRLEKHSRVDWVCETDEGDIAYNSIDSHALERRFTADSHASHDAIPVRMGRNFVTLANPSCHYEHDMFDSEIKTEVYRRVDRNGAVIWVSKTDRGEEVYSSQDQTVLESMFKKLRHVRLCNGAIVNVDTMEMNIGDLTQKVFRTVLPYERTDFLSRRRQVYECAMWQYWRKAQWQNFSEEHAKLLQDACEVPILGKRYYVDVQLLCQTNRETGMVRDVRVAAWHFGAAHAFGSSDARRLEEAYLVGRRPVVVCGLQCFAAVHTTPMTLTRFDDGAEYPLHRKLRAADTSAEWRCDGPPGVGLAVEDAARLEQAWVGFHEVALSGGQRVVDLDRMLQTNKATGKVRSVTRTVIPAEGSHSEPEGLLRAAAACRSWMAGGGSGLRPIGEGGSCGDDDLDWLCGRFKEFLSGSSAVRDVEASTAFALLTGRPGRQPAVAAALARLKAAAPEQVVIEVPAGADVGRFIGRGGQRKRQLEEELRRLAADAGADPAGLRLAVDAAPRGRLPAAVRLEVSGDAKAVLGPLVACVRAALSDACGVPLADLRLAAAAAGAGGGEAAPRLRANPRLLELASREPPTKCGCKDDAMLQLAHALIWECGVPVYGGFVRDWVVRGESATDVDALVPAGMSVANVASALKSAAARRGLTFARERAKGAAQAVSFGHGSFSGEIDVDLVDPSKIPRSPPGVDADIDNMMIDQRGALVLKVPDAASQSLPLAKCVKHAQRRKFVFFYSLQAPASDANFHRLKKLLDKGFVCLSPVPAPFMHSLTPEQQQRIQPKPKYDRRWWDETK